MKHGCRSVSSRWNPFQLTMLAIFIIFGTGVSVTVFQLLVVAEEDLSTHTFAAVFASEIDLFMVFFRVRLLGIRAVADGLDVNPVRGSVDVSQQIMRSYGVLLSSLVNTGLFVLSQVSNTPAAIALWEAGASLRWGSPVRVHAAAAAQSEEDASAGLDDMWVIEDASSVSSLTLPHIGLDITSNKQQRRAVASLVSAIASGGTLPTTAAESLAPSFGNGVVMTDIMTDPGSGVSSFTVYTTLHAGDARHLVAVTSALDAFIDPILSRSTQAVIEISDHSGGKVVKGGCSMDEALSELTGSFAVTTSAVWRIRIGECPAYRAQFVTWKRWVFVSVIAAATLFLMEIYSRQLKKVWALVLQKQELVTSQSYIHNLIVGYVCHEVRNPLHVLKVSYEVMSTVLHSLLARSDVHALLCFNAESTIEDVRCAIADGSDAILQMQSTVNDVLDLSAMTNGTFKMTPAPVRVATALLPILRRCRAYLSPDITFSYSIPDDSVIAYLDMFRVSQLLSNAISNAGKFVPPHGSVDVDIRAVNNADGHMYLVMTVSNSRLDEHSLGDPELLFIPFKSTLKEVSSTSSWKPTTAPVEHVDKMRNLWLKYRPSAARKDGPLENPNNGGTLAGEIAPLVIVNSAPVAMKTGLGLPLCRAISLAGKGWVGIFDGSLSTWEDKFASNTNTGLKSARQRRNHRLSLQQLETVCVESGSQTQFWVVLQCDAPADAVAPAVEYKSSNLGALVGDSSRSIHPCPLPTLITRVLSSTTDAGFGRMSTTQTIVLDGLGPTSPGGASTFGTRVQFLEVKGAGAISHLRSWQDAEELECKEPQAAASAYSDVRVLLVDDEASNRRIGLRALQGLGVNSANVVVMNDGASALEYMSNASNDGNISVALMDIRMPGLSGIEVMKAIGRKMPYPVIAVTGSVEPATVAELQLTGFNGCLSKPFNKDDLQFAIAQALQDGAWFLRLTKA